MNTPLAPCLKAIPRRAAAFTLPELVTAMVVFSLAVAGTLSSHLLGLRMFNLTATRLNASYNARAALNQVRDDIRSAAMLYVGTGNDAGFTNAPENSAQAGNALQIYPTTATNAYIRYYMDPGEQQLKRMTSGLSAAAASQVLASSVTNQIVFRAEDYAANVLTNSQDTRVIEMTLEFYQAEFPMASLGSATGHDYYRVQTRTARRAIE